jgi:glycerol dehydrogenase
MMAATTSRGFGSPLKYIQGPGEFNQLETYTKVYGKRALIAIDGFLFDSLNARLKEIYGASESEFLALKFGGECCEEECNRLGAELKAYRADVLAAVGGGKTMDTVKIAANEAGIPLIIVPTSASTDAATSSLSVLYTKEGVYVKNVRHKKNADLVLMDSEIIAKAPIRLFVAGMGDALATYIEALANEKSGAANFIGKGYRQCKAAMALSKLSFDILMADGVSAKLALESGALTEAVENVIEANTLLSGLGFENAGLACAHGIHSGLTELSETHKYYHGEKVAFGIVCELVLENAETAFVDKVLRFMTEIGLPVTLGDLDVKATPENVRKIAHKTAVENKLIQAEPFLITEDMVYNAIITADALGQKYKQDLP